MKFTSKILILFLIAIIPLFCHSQKTKFEIGIEGGPSLSTIRLDAFFFPSKYCLAGMGYTIGLAFKYNLNDRFALKTNLSYERLILYHSWLEPSAWWNYLVLPALFQLKIGKSRHFFLNMGPFVGFALSNYRNEDSAYKKFDYGVTMGIGFDIPIFNQWSLTSEIRENLGFLDIGKGSGDYDEYTSSLIIQIGLMYNFGQKRAK